MDEQMSKDSLEYHEKGKKGKVALQLTKPCETQYELSLAYSPGVAAPCLAIKDQVENVWKYTARGNSIAVVSDGSAVLGLGDLGAEGALPVMEGKGVLFKRFADVDAFPLCIQHVRDDNGRTDVDKVVEFVKRVEPTYGGINLEDIAAPACFEIEERLKKETNIAIFHDDQHGTAIISLAGLLNSLKITGKDISTIKVVFNGAGASGVACAKLFLTAGVKPENLFMCDSRGVIHHERTGLNAQKEFFVRETDARTLPDAMKGADVFVGVSVAGCVTKEMVESMNKDPIILAMANPTPEIMPQDALDAGASVVGTGRSDFPNQVNNVLGFPGIFRGALDTEATDINEEMKVAAANALAELANEKVPDDIKEYLIGAYPEDGAAGMFDGDNPLKNTYVIPKPFDPRVVPRVARYVAKAAMDSGVAMAPIDDLDAYEKEVEKRVKGVKVCL